MIRFFKGAKAVFLCLAVILVTIASGCGGKDNGSVNVPNTQNTHYEQPEKVVSLALDKLKKGSYDTAFIFDGERFGDTINRGLYSIVFKKFDYKILSQTENADGTAIVTVEIANLDFSNIVKDFSKLNADKKQLSQMTVKDKENIVIGQLNKVTKTFSTTLDIKLVKGKKHYQILNKADMYTASSGHFLNGEYPSAQINGENDPQITDEPTSKDKSETNTGSDLGGPRSTLSEEADTTETDNSSDENNNN